ncbi:DUF4383 domain-containing protein [Streptomyces durbertensis]|uniref:DUF4383 domain-containing protein n=1 Tax=Streptomyces durbertensis TaxID=2448886 RepID=A0ABR6EP70_9ACTN|nr:DUF4383 domain-containing protein [Streptomyces durbertensis]MBB1247131.1 DUF4383 domain-containing protein [Streptomyces durbertensis]
MAASHTLSHTFHRVNAELETHLPAGHPLSRLYRFGAGLMGVVLAAFGVLGLIDRVGFFSTGDTTIAGLSTNGALSVLSVGVGGVLFLSAMRGGNFASNVNVVLGVAFLLSGFVNLALLETDWNFLNFRIQNVVFSFVVGLLLAFFGMYGRVAGRLPYDNPYWQARHPGEADKEARRRSLRQRRLEELPPKSSLPRRRPRRPQQ